MRKGSRDLLDSLIAITLKTVIFYIVQVIYLRYILHCP